jgi:integrase
MNAIRNNVHLLNAKSVHNSINSFLNEKGDSSSNTRMAYEKDIKNFFMTMLSKELSQLTPDDLRFEKPDIINYRTYLKEMKKADGVSPKYKNSSINRFIDSVRSLFIELRSNGYSEYIDEFAFNFKNLPENDSKTAGDLTEEEFNLMVKKALTLENGLMKSLLIGLAARTSIRLSALLKLTWKDITRINHGEWEGRWLVNVVDKGNKEDEKPIEDVFYEQLLDIQVDGQDKIFSISDTAVNRFIKRLCEMIGIDEERNITFHSLKGYGANTVIDNGGSMEDAKRQCNHVSIATTSKYYMRRVKDYSKYAGIIMDSKFDTTPLEELDKEQLLSLIKATSTRTQRDIMAVYKVGKYNA